MIFFWIIDLSFFEVTESVFTSVIFIVFPRCLYSDSSALKKSSVNEIVVQRCSQLWQLWGHIAAELLVSQDLPMGLTMTSGNGITTAIDGKGGGEIAKNAFMDLLAPKNGVGKLTIHHNLYTLTMYFL